MTTPATCKKIEGKPLRRDVAPDLYCVSLFTHKCVRTNLLTLFNQFALGSMVRDNHIAVGCRVEGVHRPLGPNPNPIVKRRV